MDSAEYAVAGIHLVDHDAKGKDVHHIGKGKLLAAHLAIDAVEMFFASADLAGQALLFEPLLDGALDLLHYLAAVAAGAFHRLLEYPVAYRVVGGKAQFLKLKTQPVQAQAGGNGDIDLQGLAGDAAFLVRTHYPEGTHVVESVGEFDQDDADILHHRQHHFAEVFRLGLGLGFELDVGQLADPVHQFGHLVAKALCQLFLGGGGVFDNVVQDGGDQAFVVETHLGQNFGYRKGMVDIGLTTETALPLMGLGAEQVGLVNLLHLIGFKITLEHGAEITNQEGRLHRPIIFLFRWLRREPRLHWQSRALPAVADVR